MIIKSQGKSWSIQMISVHLPVFKPIKHKLYVTVIWWMLSKHREEKKTLMQEQPYVLGWFNACTIHWHSDAHADMCWTDLNKLHQPEIPGPQNRLVILLCILFLHNDFILLFA